VHGDVRMPVLAKHETVEVTTFPGTLKSRACTRLGEGTRAPRGKGEVRLAVTLRPPPDNAGT
jgi:hypothetical protein